MKNPINLNEFLDSVLSLDLSIKAKYLLILMKLKPELSSFEDLSPFMNVSKSAFQSYLREIKGKGLTKIEHLKSENGRLSGAKRILLI